MALRRKARSYGRRRTMRRSGRRIRGVSIVGPRGAYPTMGPIRAFRGKRVNRGRVGTKRRFRSAVGANKRRRTVKDPAGYTQWDQSRVTRTFGRLTQRKVNAVSSDYYDLLWKRVGRLDIGGQLYLGSWQDGNVCHRPIMLIDLTSAQNISETASPVYQLSRELNVVTPTMTWTAVNGQTAAGGFATPWQIAARSDSEGVKRRALLKWTEVRADIWGTKEHPCEWIFTLCQLDPRVLPEDGNYISALNDANAIKWWDSISGQLVFSPSERKINEGLTANNVRVLDRRSFVMNPTSTTETDADPHVRSVRMFFKMNRKCNFGYEDRIASAGDANDPAQGPTFKPLGNTNLRAYVDPKARVFMMITCRCWRAPFQSYSEMSPSNTPSFNLAVYNRWITN